MIRRPPRSTQSRSSAASDVYKRQADLGLAAEAGLAVDLHPAGAADRRPAGAADRERAVVAVLHLQDPVEDRERGLELDLELLPEGPLAALGLVTANFQRVLGHLAPQYFLSSGSHWVIVTSEYEISGPSSPCCRSMCLSHSPSSRSGKSVLYWSPRLSLRSSAATQAHSALSSM